MDLMAFQPHFISTNLAIKFEAHVQAPTFFNFFMYQQN